ncbi:MAG: TVP38/TMEM64 family protein [Alphaproteobacteria bacterium]|nr:TVP38/TMEM64 family protein [Alphaproteobacteria bacterium]
MRFILTQLRQRKLLIAALVGLMVLVVLPLVFGQYQDAVLANVQARHDAALAWFAENPILSRVLYFTLFVTFIGFYLPGGILFLLLSGALFSFWEGFLMASFANLVGAVVGMLISRKLLQGLVVERFPERIAQINAGLAAHGVLYLMLLRIAPVIPSPVVNLVMGVTAMPLFTYVWVTLVGRIPMSALYVNLGAQLDEIDSLSDLLSLEIVLSLSLIAVLIAGGAYVARRMHPASD